MAGWLTTAVNALHRRSHGEETFEILCACGEGVPGRRTDHEQEILCPRCGERLFVLPADVYPRTAALPPLHRTPAAVNVSHAASRRVMPRCGRLCRQLLDAARATLGRLMPWHSGRRRNPHGK